MKELLYSNHTFFKKENAEWIILNLLHELRVMTAEQLNLLLNLEFDYSTRAVYSRLTSLLKSELIDYIQVQEESNLRYFFLTKKGHNSIGGLYTFPKVPEYNLKHHVEVTNYLIESMTFAKQKSTFLLAQSERRQMYEKKDMAKAKRGTIFHVADFVLRFENPEREISDWHFEIELTLKSQNRYLKAIFPKYIQFLRQKQDCHVVYVTPSQVIYNALDDFKAYFEIKSQEKEAFDRLHIISSSQFSEELPVLLNENEFIND